MCTSPDSSQDRESHECAKSACRGCCSLQRAKRGKENNTHCGEWLPKIGIFTMFALYYSPRRVSLNRCTASGLPTSSTLAWLPRPKPNNVSSDGCPVIVTVSPLRLARIAPSSDRFKTTPTGELRNMNRDIFRKRPQSWSSNVGSGGRGVQPGCARRMSSLWTKYSTVFMIVSTGRNIAGGPTRIFVSRFSNGRNAILRWTRSV